MNKYTYDLMAELLTSQIAHLRTLAFYTKDEPQYRAGVNANLARLIKAKQLVEMEWWWKNREPIAKMCLSLAWGAARIEEITPEIVLHRAYHYLYGELRDNKWTGVGWRVEDALLAACTAENLVKVERKPALDYHAISRQSDATGQELIGVMTELQSLLGSMQEDGTYTDS